jgi:hypothetical protein
MYVNKLSQVFVILVLLFGNKYDYNTQIWLQYPKYGYNTQNTNMSTIHKIITILNSNCIGSYCLKFRMTWKHRRDFTGPKLDLSSGFSPEAFPINGYATRQRRFDKSFPLHPQNSGTILGQKRNDTNIFIKIVFYIGKHNL